MKPTQFIKDNILYLKVNCWLLLITHLECFHNNTKINVESASRQVEFSVSLSDWHIFFVLLYKRLVLYDF